MSHVPRPAPTSSRAPRSALAGLLVLLLGLVSQAAAAAPLRVALLPAAAPSAGQAARRDELQRRLALDPDTTVSADAGGAEVVWLLVDWAGPGDLQAAAAARARGAGLVLAPAEARTGAAPGLEAMLGAQIDAPQHDEVSLQDASATARLRDLPLRSAPRIAARLPLHALPDDAVLASFATAAPAPALLLREAAAARDQPRPSGRLVLVAAALLSEDNAALRRWGYGNYLLHGLTALAAGRPPSAFATWAAAPVPHATARAVWVVGLLLLWPLTLLCFLWARRATRRAGEGVAHDFFAAIDHQTRLDAGLAARPLDQGAAADAAEARDAARIDAGFHRPLSGFLVMVCALCVFIAPYVAVVQFLLPTYIQRFPEVDGMWNGVYEVTYWVWILFDMGTSLGFVKYFAELRRKDPKEALAMVQFFNWWQIFTGGVQVTLIGLCAVFILPHTQYALYAHLLAIYGLAQWPGVFQSFYYFFQAAQRYDYFQVVDMLQNRLLVVVVPIPLVLLGRYLGARSLAYGEALGAILGMAAGAYVGGLLVLAVSLYFYRRMGARVAPLFLAGFTRASALRVLTFGFQVTLGNLPHKLANAAEILILGATLLAREQALGIRSFLVYKFCFLYTFLNGWTQPAVATFSEAHGLQQWQRLRYAIARYFQYGHLFCAVIFAFLVALGPTLITRAIDPAWASAAVLLPLAAAYGLLLPAAWITDSALQGGGRPGYSSLLMFLEQGIRLGLFFVLIPRLQIAGIFVALLLTLLFKAVLGWFLIDRLVVRLRVPLWSAVVAPHLAGALSFLLWRAALALLGHEPGRAAVVALTVVAGVAAFPLGLWLLGFLGALSDAAALRELTHGAGMATGFRGVARLLVRAAAAGARHSPLGAFSAGLSFPPDFVAAAEAELLTPVRASEAAPSTLASVVG